jgi:hypothetical protein
LEEWSVGMLTEIQTHDLVLEQHHPGCGFTSAYQGSRRQVPTRMLSPSYSIVALKHACLGSYGAFVLGIT